MRSRSQNSNQTARMLVVGDLHFDWNPRYLDHGQHDKYLYNVLLEVLAHAKRLKVHAVVFTGDVFDNAQPSQEARATFTRFLSFAAVRHPELLLVFYPGNHDTEVKAETKPVYSMRFIEPLCGPDSVLKNVVLTHRPKRISIGGAPVQLLPWFNQHDEATVTQVTEMLNGKSPSIVFAHNEVRGAMFDNGWVADGLDLSKTKHWWYIGHLHTPHELHKGRVVYVGTPTVRHVNHKPRGALLLTVQTEDGKIRSVRHEDVALKQPYWVVEGPVPKKYREDTFYKVHVPVGEPIPAHPRVYDYKLIGAEIDAAKAKKKDARPVKAPVTLPKPTDWLVSLMPPEKQDRTRMLLIRAGAEGKKGALHDEGV